MISRLVPVFVINFGTVALVSSAALAQTAAPLVAPSPTTKSAGAPVGVEEPRDLVAALYRLAAAEAKKAKPLSPFYDARAREKYFTKSFDLLVTTSETKAAHDNASALDFDPISASQDAELQKVTLKTDLLELNKAVVSATFLNHKLPTVVTYDFVKEDGSWKINDIKGTTEKEAWSVRKILRTDGKQPTKLPGMPEATTAPDASAPLPPKKDPDAK